MISNKTSNYSADSVKVALYAYLSLGLVGFILNMFVCLVIITHSVLRQSFNYLILNLSLSDLLVSLATVLIGILDYFTVTGFTSYQNISVLCTIDIAIAVISLHGACLTLLVMSIERYQAVTVVRLRKIKQPIVRKIIVIIWLIAAISAIIPTIHAKLDPHYPYDCTIGRISNYALLIICIILFSATCILPIAIMLIVYGMVAYKFTQKMAAIESSPSPIVNRERTTLYVLIPLINPLLYNLASNLIVTVRSTLVVVVVTSYYRNLIVSIEALLLLYLHRTVGIKDIKLIDEE
ncbi:5-hydroxytryptamine receptor 7 [Trichoplax sp. H2]|nr:5-hydroxytryptamine receptor 7 [Trichoplax sp. H2]|eukprot:RDD46560.1 5-hydroxytryptamine receptor 7 [Trichoplax sp. H2]